VASSAVKALILIAVVVLGIVLLRKAFPEGAAEPIGASSSLSGTVTPTGSTTPTSPASPRVHGVNVQVLNGTTVAGLAAQVSTTLRQDGYNVKAPQNAATAQKTVIYFQPGFELEAKNLRSKRFHGARVQAAPSSVPDGVDIQVVLGTDFQPS
jgi:hypothetical protein